MSALAGIRIVDFTQGVAGPLATMLLGDFEADVLKVEPPGGDRVKDEPGYLCWNRNKRVTTLNLQTYDGLKAARDLIAGADVAVFDHHPGELERLGLDAATLRARQLGLIHAWMPPYGAEGRWSQLPPDELLLAAVSSVSFQQSSYNDQPVYLVTPQIAYGHGVLAAGSIAAALYQRATTGEGRALTVSGLHGVSGVESGGIMRAGEVFRFGSGTSRGGVPNYRLYECADGKWFFLGTLTQPFFLRALEATDMMHLMALDEVQGEFTNLLRPPALAIAIAALEERFKEKPREEWLRILHEAGVPRGPVGERNEWFAGETVAANEMRVELDDDTRGKVVLPGVSLKLSDTPGSVRRLPTPAGEVDWPARNGIAGAPPQVRSTGPLAGVRILDLGAFIAGTFAPAVLAQWGADVIKVEPPEGDAFRTYGLGFVGYNRGKRSLSLDLKSPEGRGLFLELVRKSDVVLDNYRVGVRERLGIDYKSLAQVNPRIISISITGYGPSGPLSADPGFDPLIQARSGMMHAQGGGVEPVFYQIPVNDTGTAMMGALGICLALNARERTGRGQEIFTSLANQSVIFQSGEITWYEGRPPALEGGLDYVGPLALRRLYQCSDGWVAVSCTEPAQFHSLCIALGHPEWAGRNIAERAMEEAGDGPLATSIADALLEMDRDEAVDRLLARGVPAGPAIRVDELFRDPHAIANRLTTTIDYEPLNVGPIGAVRALSDWDGWEGGYPRSAPVCGAHTTEVLAEFGNDDARIAELLAAGVVRQG
jgi:crotonobetainyl-CoA:carnitine CoA-transferase CaiB-like acyl-CoA transferase